MLRLFSRPVDRASWPDLQVPSATVKLAVRGPRRQRDRSRTLGAVRARSSTAGVWRGRLTASGGLIQIGRSSRVPALKPGRRHKAHFRLRDVRRTAHAGDLRGERLRRRPRPGSGEFDRRRADCRKAGAVTVRPLRRQGIRSKDPAPPPSGPTDSPPGGSSPAPASPAPAPPASSPPGTDDRQRPVRCGPRSRPLSSRSPRTRRAALSSAASTRRPGKHAPARRNTPRSRRDNTPSRCGRANTAARNTPDAGRSGVGRGHDRPRGHARQVPPTGLRRTTPPRPSRAPPAPNRWTPRR